MLSSAFPAILLYAQELLPTKLGLISGLFFGFAFGVAGVASAVLGNLADKTSIEYVYNICAYMPLLGLDIKMVPGTELIDVNIKLFIKKKENDRYASSRRIPVYKLRSKSKN